MRLLTMSGLVPEQVCDIVRFTGYKGERNISHYCGYASDYISQVRADNSIDGAVFPRSCDSSRIIKNYLEDSGKFIYQMSVPARQDEMAVEFFATDIENYKKELELYFKIKIDDIEIRAELINRRNIILKSVYEDVASISYGEYLSAIHNMLQASLPEQVIPTSFGGKRGKGKNVFLVGSFLCNVKVANIIENSGMVIVGDNLPESGRLVSAPTVNLCNELYKEIARSILGNRLSPTQNNFSDIISKDIKEIKKKAVQGVIFVTQKYCESYDYLFSVYKKRLDLEGIPVLKLVMSDSEDERKVELVIEAFSDMI